MTDDTTRQPPARDVNVLAAYKSFVAPIGNSHDIVFAAVRHGYDTGRAADAEERRVERAAWEAGAIIGDEATQKAYDERDALAQQIAAVRALLDSTSDERGITWWEWIDGGLGGSLYADLRAILDPSPVTPEPQTITVTPEVLAKLQEGPPTGSIPYAGYGPQYWVNLDEIHPPVTPESETN